VTARMVISWQIRRFQFVETSLSVGARLRNPFPSAGVRALFFRSFEPDNKILRRFRNTSN
jgi:hypothetical protein